MKFKLLCNLRVQNGPTGSAYERAYEQAARNLLAANTPAAAAAAGTLPLELLSFADETKTTAAATS